MCDLDDRSGPACARCDALAREPELLAAMDAEEWVGRSVELGDGGEGVNVVVGARRAP